MKQQSTWPYIDFACYLYKHNGDNDERYDNKIMKNNIDYNNITKDNN